VSGSILGACVASYNASFSGDVRINGNYGTGNANSSSPTVYLNKAAFSDPAPYTVGNTPRSAPTTNIDSASFGAVTGQANSPRNCS
jgi:hypothetical protein